MRKIISTALALVMFATSSVTFAGTSEARHRDRNYYERHHDYRDHYRDRRRHRNDDAAAAAIIGLALGAIVVGSLANQNRRVERNYYYDDRYERRDSRWEHIRRCEARYRSYDRRSDTFIGRDGRRYYCNL